MADEVESSPASPSQDETPGARLRAAREALGRSTREIAGTLNMDAWMLDAIERNEFSALGAPVFAKGHLRKYARTLDIDPDDLMVGYYEVAGSRETPPLIADSILRAEASRPASYAWLLPAVVIVAAIAAVAAAALWYLRTDRPVVSAAPEAVARDNPTDEAVQLSLPAPLPMRRTTDDVSATRAVPLPAAAGRAAAADSDGSSGSSGSSGSAEAAGGAIASAPAAAPGNAGPRTAERVAPEPAAAAPPEPAATGRLRLTMRFRTDSWVEVYDGERRKLLYGMGEAGTTQNLDGVAPLQVFLGRYSGVDIEVDGRPFTIPRASRRSNTARFRIEQPPG